jgi:hypothetical protein
MAISCQDTEFCRHNHLCCFSTSVHCCKHNISLSTQSGNFWIRPRRPKEPGQLSGKALGYGLDDRGFEFWQGVGIFLFTTAYRPALRPTQPPFQGVPGDLFLGVKRPGCEAECVELYLHSPNSPSWCGSELKQSNNFLYLYLFNMYTYVFRNSVCRGQLRTF